MKDEFRCYTFTNFMLSSIQQGIQSGHASMELVNKYMIDTGWVDGYAEAVADWVKNHKTIVCLNAGNAEGVRDWKAFLDDGWQRGVNCWPYAAFYEDEQSLDGALTSVAILLAPLIYETAAAIRGPANGIERDVDRRAGVVRYVFDDTFEDGPKTETFTFFEENLMRRLNVCRLAQ